MNLDELRTAFRAERCHYVTVPGVLVDTTKLREEIDRAPFTIFDEPDRGRYEITDDIAVPAMFDELRGLAEQLVERPLTLHRAVWQRLRHRDYMLIKGDAADRLAAPHVELTLDLSAAATGGAELVYTDGLESWGVAQEPGSVTIVEREPWLFRYDRYLDIAVGDKLVHRLRLILT
jgi:hypothetical protein